MKVGIAVDFGRLRPGGARRPGETMGTRGRRDYGGAWKSPQRANEGSNLVKGGRNPEGISNVTQSADPSLAGFTPEIKFTLTHVCSALWASHPSLLTRLSYYGSPAGSIPGPGCQVPSFDYRKSKCRKDIHPAASLRHHKESQDLQTRSAGTAHSGTLSSWWHPQPHDSHLLVRFNLILQFRWDSHILVGNGQSWS